jgi:hypothetical protein
LGSGLAKSLSYRVWNRQKVGIRLSIFLSSPDVVRALVPTVATALVNTVPTLRIAKGPTHTHKSSPLKYARN